MITYRVKHPESEIFQRFYKMNIYRNLNMYKLFNLTQKRIIDTLSLFAIRIYKINIVLHYIVLY